MDIISIIIPGIFAVMALIHHKRLSNGQFLFNCLWCVVMLVSKINFLGLIAIKEEIYLMEIVFVCAFNLGCYFSIQLKPRIKTEAQTINKNFVKLCVLFVLVVYLFLAYRAILFLKSGSNIGLAQIRYEFFYGNGIIKNNIEYLFVTYIVEGVFNFLILYFVYNIYNEIDIWTDLIIIINVMLNIVFNGGRTVFLNLIILFILYGLYVRKTITKQKKVIVFWIVIICAIATIAISLERNVEFNALMEQGFSYFVTPLAFSSAIFDNYDVTQLGFTRVILAPIFDVIINAFRYFDLTDGVTAAVFISNLTVEPLKVFVNKDTFFNALTPAFFYFYLDSGFFGVALYSAIFGATVEYVEKRMTREKKASTHLFWMYLLLGVIFSSRGWAYMAVNNVITIFCVFLIMKRNVRNKLEGEKL